jgi:hypothetical protein
MRLARAVGALLVVAGGAFASLAPAKQREALRLHDARYCEILELRGTPPAATVTVWNTIGLNKCPDVKWRSFDAAALARERGDTFVVLNGPRHFLMDSTSAKTGVLHSFHGLRMRKVATIAIHSAAELAQPPYTDRTITRTNDWRWRKGRTVFELVAPGGDTYVMQSYAQIKDPKLTLAKLPALGKRLTLPPGWRYRSRKLTRPRVLRAKGSATILQDELQNTYQLAKTTRGKGKRVRHGVSIDGVTKSVDPATPGTIEDHGTLTGTPFGKGTIVLVGKFADNRFTGTFRLTFKRGSVLGTTDLPYKIADGTITFDGTSRFTGGTGAFRGIKSGALKTHDTNTLDGQNGRLSVRGASTYPAAAAQQTARQAASAYVAAFTHGRDRVTCRYLDPRPRRELIHEAGGRGSSFDACVKAARKVLPRRLKDVRIGSVRVRDGVATVVLRSGRSDDFSDAFRMKRRHGRWRVLDL